MIIGITAVLENADLLMHLCDVGTVEQAVREIEIEMTLLLGPDDVIVNIGVESLNPDDNEFADEIEAALLALHGFEQPE